MDGNRLRMEVLSIPCRIQSPVNTDKTYPETNVLSANSIDLGVRVGEFSMRKMYTSKVPKRVQFALDLKRKRIVVTFPTDVNNVRHDYMFEMPIALLQYVYKVDDKGTGQRALIIPFEYPPQFFERLRNEVDFYQTFSSATRWWNEYDTFYRRTDVIPQDMEDRLEGNPVMNLKNCPIINIGMWIPHLTHRGNF